MSLQVQVVKMTPQAALPMLQTINKRKKERVEQVLANMGLMIIQMLLLMIYQ